MITALAGASALIGALALPASAGAATTFREFVTPAAASGPVDIAFSPGDGELWFTENNTGAVASVNTSGTFGSQVSAPGSSPAPITIGPDGNVWFGDTASWEVDAIRNGAVSHYSLTHPFSDPEGFASDGTNLWFTESGSAYIGEISMSGTILHEYPLSDSSSAPNSIVRGPDGAFWFTENGTDRIGRITTGGSITEFSIPTASSGPTGISVGPDGALWFTEKDANKIGRITTAGSIAEYSVLTASAAPDHIVAGRDGNLWFTEYVANKIGRITTGGAITEYPIPAGNSGPEGITVDGSGNVWFAESNAGAIGELALSAPVITSGSKATFPIGRAGSFTITTSGNPAVTLSESGALPAGVTYT
ncbi:MAG: hypothetical protein M3025_06420, partial [Actinomycetota bacterium]|nr:hypothetical protein [Actinomycetota bacterium]